MIHTASLPGVRAAPAPGPAHRLMLRCLRGFLRQQGRKRDPPMRAKAKPRARPRAGRLLYCPVAPRQIPQLPPPMDLWVAPAAPLGVRFSPADKFVAPSPFRLLMIAPSREMRGDWHARGLFANRVLPAF